MGRLDQAKQWLEKAFALGDAKEMKLAAEEQQQREEMAIRAIAEAMRKKGK